MARHTVGDKVPRRLVHGGVEKAAASHVSVNMIHGRVEMCLVRKSRDRTPAVHHLHPVDLNRTGLGPPDLIVKNFVNRIR